MAKIATVVFSLSLLISEETIDSLEQVVLKRLGDGRRDLVTLNKMVSLTKLYNRTDLNQALDWGLKSLELGRKFEGELDLAKAHNQVGVTFWRQGLYNLALNHYAEAAKIFHSLKKKDLEAWNFISIGNAYFKQEIYDLALEQYNRALHIFTEIQDSNGMALSFNNMAMVSDERKQFDNALNFYMNAVELRKGRNPTFELSYSYNQLGKGYLNIGDVTKAMEYFGLGLTMAIEVQSTDNVARSYQNIASLYEIKGDAEQALDNYKKAIEWDDQPNLPGLYLTIAQIYRKQSQINSALEAAQKAAEIANFHHLIEEEAEAFKTISQIFTMMNKPEDALEALNRHLTVKDLVKRSEITKAITRMEISREAERRREELAIVQSEVSLKNLQRNALIAVALLLVIIIYGLIHRYLYIKRMSKKVQDQQAQLHEQEQQQLNMEINQKKRELTTKAMTMAQNREFTVKILDELKMVKSKGESEVQGNVDKLINTINSYLETRDEWKEFELWFEEVHGDFFDKLSEAYPDLTPGDRKLCALLKLNLRSKEIASITQLTLGTIEEYRRRLRKKLNVPKDANLVTFISNL